MTVETSGGKKRQAMVYVMRDDAKFGVPTALYYDIIACAYVNFKFDFDILSEALYHSYYNADRLVNEH